MSPKYFTRTECPGEFFVCEKMRGAVSVSWCAKTWSYVNGGGRSHRWGSSRRTIRDTICLRCPLGAKHAGAEFVPSSIVVDVRVCPRCRRVSGRLIRSRLCVSCYNRDRERQIGRNAKGTKPKRLPVTHQVEVFARVSDSRPVVCKEMCVDGIEAVIAAFRSLGALAAIGFRAKPMPVQADLFEGLA